MRHAIRDITFRQASKILRFCCRPIRPYPANGQGTCGRPDFNSNAIHQTNTF
ncbi:hypothetical protein Cst_c17150 [Thermoclostridium stercorarium subsp. stercorarium DSM 8532]|uniref:Uncharacterized protein n=1 Tax=Thermoclostridium stercorarium (strain ATCC 35414 / DSM 8532 / NCIMB 11754) TaxID=1121335 RepID=L7VPJ5_THES1|nr:hypothetical protein Cst_c17150 [Thermoclostridium stercorarium subsp. stercorarium DSM 8532]